MERHVALEVLRNIGGLRGVDDRLGLGSQQGRSVTGISWQIEATAGGSSSIRTLVMSTSVASDISVTRNPRLRSTSTRPCRESSSIASRTGVAETPNSRASEGAENSSPGARSPEMIAERIWANTVSRKLARFNGGMDVRRVLIGGILPGMGRSGRACTARFR
ncbi:MAG: hypothetical protein LKI24_13365 [Acidipropionibacterium sp.]|nr:hypothetical protein [Acidipropionibacterium sp.]